MEDNIRTAIVEVSGPMGLHGRPAAQLAKLASGFSSEITLCRCENPENPADCRSILSLLILAASTGTKLLLEVTGDDCDAACSAVEAFFAAGFDQDVETNSTRG